jgi:hypothetical protein
MRAVLESAVKQTSYDFGDRKVGPRAERFPYPNRGCRNRLPVSDN